MTETNSNSIRDRLRMILAEFCEQSHLANHFGGEFLSFNEELEQIREFVEDAGEYGIAYECMVSVLEKVPFALSGKAAVSLLEVGLLFGYKTDRPCDKPYDRRDVE
jgi:hypothetical protein